MKSSNIQEARSFIRAFVEAEAASPQHIKTDEFKLYASYDEEGDHYFIVVFPNSGALEIFSDREDYGLLEDGFLNIFREELKTKNEQLKLRLNKVKEELAIIEAELKNEK